MKIQLLSDLHLEVHPHWMPQPAAGAELLVLAGDIGSYQANSQLTDANFGLDRFSPLQGWPTPVIFVPGNHEYDTLDFDLAHQRLRDTCERLGLIWLERETVVLSGLRFVGTTLWSDFDALGPTLADVSNEKVGKTPSVLARAPHLLALQLKAREKASRAANYYLKRTLTTRHGTQWLADGVREQALLCQQWLHAALDVPFAGTTVAVTHYAPSLQSADPRYGRTPGTAGFCNALDVLLPKAKLWLHGHLHTPSDYQQDGCRVVANPLGYARKKEQAAFRPDLLLEVN